MALETKELLLDGYKNSKGEMEERLYILTQLPATKGLEVQLKLDSGVFSADLVREVVSMSTALGSVKLEGKRYEEHFAGRYAHLMKLFNEILDFNFGENFPEGVSEEQ